MHRLPSARHRRLTVSAARRSPVTRREIAERLFRHTVWVQRKPDAMWDVEPAVPAATAR